MLSYLVVAPVIYVSVPALAAKSPIVIVPPVVLFNISVPLLYIPLTIVISVHQIIQMFLPVLFVETTL